MYAILMTNLVLVKEAEDEKVQDDYDRVITRRNRGDRRLG